MRSVYYARLPFPTHEQLQIVRIPVHIKNSLYPLDHVPQSPSPREASLPSQRAARSPAYHLCAAALSSTSELQQTPAVQAADSGQRSQDMRAAALSAARRGWRLGRNAAAARCVRAAGAVTDHAHRPRLWESPMQDRDGWRDRCHRRCTGMHPELPQHGTGRRQCQPVCSTPAASRAQPASQP